MGREYQHSVKTSLTKKIVAIILVAVLVLYALTIFIILDNTQRDYTKTLLSELQMNSFKGNLTSCAGKIS